MTFTKLLFTKEAQAIWRHIAKQFSPSDLQRYGYVLANYCNELATLHRVERELATLSDLVIEYANRDGQTNTKKHELLKVRSESLTLVTRLATELKLTPRAAAWSKADPGDHLELPPA